MPEEAKDISEKVLLVDDDPDVLDMLSDVCDSIGCPKDTACNGARAIELYERNGYHLIITDFDMPELDGLGLLKRVRRSKHGKETHVVLLSGTHVTKLRDCGFDECVQKPVDIYAMQACIRKYNK
jgi:two-component system chemotaxis response regulator CheY